MTSELQIFQDYIRQRGLRRTPEREEILREIFEVHGHFDVDGLYLQLYSAPRFCSASAIPSDCIGSTVLSAPPCMMNTGV